jgi:hypothetical protein
MHGNPHTCQNSLWFADQVLDDAGPQFCQGIILLDIFNGQVKPVELANRLNLVPVIEAVEMIDQPFDSLSCSGILLEF